MQWKTGYEKLKNAVITVSVSIQPIIFRDCFGRYRLITFVQAQFYSDVISHYVIITFLSGEFCGISMISDNPVLILLESRMLFLSLVDSVIWNLQNSV